MFNAPIDTCEEHSHVRKKYKGVRVTVRVCARGEGGGVCVCTCVRAQGKRAMVCARVTGEGDGLCVQGARMRASACARGEGECVCKGGTDQGPMVSVKARVPPPLVKVARTISKTDGLFFFSKGATYEECLSTVLLACQE